MAIYYVHPVLGDDTTAVAGDYTKPRRTISDDGRVQPWTTYYLAAGFTHVGFLVSPAVSFSIPSSDAVVDTYDPVTGGPVVYPNMWDRARAGQLITDTEKNTLWAKFVGNSAATDYDASDGMQFREGCQRSVVRGLWFSGFHHSGVRFNNSGASNCTLDSCIVSDILTPTGLGQGGNPYGGDGIYGDENTFNNTITNCLLENIGEDFLHLFGSKDYQIVGNWARLNGRKIVSDQQHCDFAQFDGMPGNFRIENNWVEVILDDILAPYLPSNGGVTGGAVVVATNPGGDVVSGGIIKNNVFIYNQQGIYFERQPGVLITGNIFWLKQRAPGFTPVSTVLSPASALRAETPDVSFVGNLVVIEDPTINGVICVVDRAPRMKSRNNTYISLGVGTNYALSAAYCENVESVNDIFIGFAIGQLDPAKSMIHKNNIFYNCVNPRTASPLGLSIPLPLDSSEQITNPQLDSNYIPILGSPCQSAGLSGSGTGFGVNGMFEAANPNIGAYENRFRTVFTPRV